MGKKKVRSDTGERGLGVRRVLLPKMGMGRREGTQSERGWGEVGWGGGGGDVRVTAQMEGGGRVLLPKWVWERNVLLPQWGWESVTAKRGNQISEGDGRVLLGGKWESVTQNSGGRARESVMTQTGGWWWWWWGSVTAQMELGME